MPIARRKERVVTVEERVAPRKERVVRVEERVVPAKERITPREERIGRGYDARFSSSRARYSAS